MQPGVSFNTGQQQGDAQRPQRGGGIAISISGGRSTDNAFRIDGLVVNDYANSGPGSSLRVNLGVDAIREFSVLTNNYSAEYGRGSSGVVNAITKSGTNQVHGTAYYFHRNSAMDAQKFFDPAVIPPFRRHQYGGALGGAIKKDKTFFFTNYERLTEIRSQSSSVDVMSANVHNGILCSNPPSCTQTTQVAVAPTVKPYLALYPLPNGPVNGNFGKFNFGSPRIGSEHYIFGKIDHYFSQATTISGSYSYDDTKVNAPDVLNLKLTGSPTRRQNAVVNLQHIFSSNLINNTRVGVTRTSAAGNLDSDPRNPALTDVSLGFLPGRTLGQFVIPGVTGVLTGLGASGLNLYGYTAPQVYNDLSWTKGRHSIRTGFNFERIIYNINSSASPYGAWNFASLQTFLQGTPSLLRADFPGTDTIRGERNSIVAGYLQDDFRVRSNLTLNLGVRYEMATVIKEVNGKLANLRRMTDSAVTVGDPFYNNPTLKNWAPRIGFAWDPFKDGKTAIRGGVGLFDVVPLPYIFQIRIARTVPFFRAGVLNNPPVSSFPNQAFQLLSPSTATTVHIDPDPSRSYKAQWNLNIQRQLTRSMALTVGYIGSSGVHLNRNIQDADQVPPTLVKWNGTNLVFPVPAAGQPIQRINPNFGQIVYTDWSGHSTYHSLQANLVQRLSKGLAYQVAYTWSNSMDNGSAAFTDTESTNTATAPWAFDPRINRGVSEFNIPHNLVANFQYDVPVPAAVRARPFANTVFGGWQLGGIYTRQSGGPFTVKLGGDRAFTGNAVAGATQGGQRPNYVAAPGCTPRAAAGNIDNYIMTQCFGFPAAGVLGNLGRNTLRMPVFRNLDFSVFKNQNLWGEKLKAQLRVEMFNILNNTNLQNQTLTIFDGSGNLVSNVGQPHGPTVNAPRQIQFGLRLLF